MDAILNFVPMVKSAAEGFQNSLPRGRDVPEGSFNTIEANKNVVSEERDEHFCSCSLIRSHWCQVKTKRFGALNFRLNTSGRFRYATVNMRFAHKTQHATLPASTSSSFAANIIRCHPPPLVGMPHTKEVSNDQSLDLKVDAVGVGIQPGHIGRATKEQVQSAWTFAANFMPSNNSDPTGNNDRLHMHLATKNDADKQAYAGRPIDVVAVLHAPAVGETLEVFTEAKIVKGVWDDYTKLFRSYFGTSRLKQRDIEISRENSSSFQSIDDMFRPLMQQVDIENLKYTPFSECARFAVYSSGLRMNNKQ